MSKKYDVVTLGELLIDFTEHGISEQGNPLLEANPGGAPGNVLAMLQKLGNSTAFIGKVGQDFFGRMLVKTIEEQGIEGKGIVFDKHVPTTLALVHTKEGGERSFSFYRNPGADMCLTKKEVDVSLLKNTKIFHFGSLSMTDEGCEEATKYAISVAKEQEALLSFDPNLREPLWSSLEKAKEKIEYGLKNCHILKISDNEITFLTGETSIEKGTRKLIETYKIPFVCATAGPKGSYAFFEGKEVFAPPFLQESTIETTGAGDTFCACMLHDLLENGITNRSEESIKEMLLFANAAASIVTTRKGALKVMPTKEEVKVFLQSR